MSLSEANIFHAKQILRNFYAKKSAFVDNQSNKVQILCLVNSSDEILIHYTYYDVTTSEGITKLNNRSSVNWKLIVWFHNNGKLIQDLCFNAVGTQLLVACYDNTLHIVPILWILNPNAQEIDGNLPWPFRYDEITSFVVPFSGPHECPNPRTCPNNNKNIKKRSSAATDDENECNQLNLMYDEVPDNFEEKHSPELENKEVLSESSHHSDASPLEECADNNDLSSDGDSDVRILSDRSEHQNCPYPTAAVWWTIAPKKDPSQKIFENRVVIGYSDGSICVVCKLLQLC